MLGEKDVTEGLEMAVLSMRVGEKAEFEVGPGLCYGDAGLEKVPPDSTILYFVHLLDFHEKRWGLSDEEMHERVKAIKAEGDDLFRKGEFCAAIARYE